MLFFCVTDVFLDVKCTEEAHRPVDCGTVSKWILKNSAESENMNWYRISFCIFNITFMPVFLWNISLLVCIFCFYD